MPRVQLHVVVQCAPSAAGTQVTRTWEMRPRWWVAPLSWVLWPLVMRRRTQHTLAVSTLDGERVLDGWAA